MSDWNTDWDPYEELMLHRNNIQQCAVAINTGSELMKELGNKYAHQQEVITQLMFQNKKLNADLSRTNLDLQRIQTELTLLKAMINNTHT